ncbi:hypothetical protein FGO68_gene7272 [Halteria grandinella]|uniref:Uncharacterized protein n=1 Tax=Halteria grandinella TaxID=5974 RepID=A0A8J8T6N7_HALGN|nr:hypothetical protein FGO68_gene7272 [Halteria grandinella]
MLKYGSSLLLRSSQTHLLSQQHKIISRKQFMPLFNMMPLRTAYIRGQEDKSKNGESHEGIERCGEEVLQGSS